MKLLAISLLVATPLPSLAAATPVDNSALTSTDAAYGRTIAQLEPRVERNPADAEAWINLAMAYRHLNHSVEADAALHRVLALDNVTLQDRFGDDVWSHTLARRALATQITAR